ncbi:MAG: hypothetical protein L6R37_003208 [Teloschistes peruensis]|nr:MAG: hypothetical protein L6R37_003208 [Teloschistes peruensis]
MIWRLRCSAGRALLHLLVVQLLWLNPTAAKKDKPEISSYKLDNPPSNFFYFDDSNTILLHDRDGGIVHRSEDAGKTWDKVDIPSGSAWDLWRHPQDNKKAYIMGKKSTHWHTNDQGKTWKDFEIPNARPSLFRAPLAFHAEDSDKVLIHGEVCKIKGILDCKETTFYTEDGFEKVGLLRENTRGCVFAHATPEFKTGDDDKNDNRIVCVTTGRVSFDRREHKLAVSDNFFEDEEEPALEGDRTVQGIINIAVVKGYLVAAARAPHTDELAMYVTTDAIEWHRGIFPSDSRLKEDAYTILESTSYSIQVDVMTADPPNPMGALFTSNSNGTYFTKNILYTNRNTNGIVDFEKVQNIDGIVLVNVVTNADEVAGSYGRAEKRLKSQISFNDGRDFNDLTADKKTLHLHSVTEMKNIGRVFSSPAPGIVMGVGNTGDYLKDYEEGDLWISDDAGLTWSKALEEAHKYEFGDQGSILVAIYDEGPTDEIQYSLDHGKKWHKVDLPESKIRAKALTTTPDSTAMKFFLWGAQGGGSKTEHWVFSIDFEDMHEDKCGKKDFEKWTARVDDNGEASCVMGRKEYFTRRKADADCFIREKGFQEQEPDFKNCECTKEDFECDYNFKKSEDGKDCVPDGPIPDPKGVCKGDTKTYQASSGFRKIPGNKCEGGEDLEKEVERTCGDTHKPPVSGEINTERTAFPAKSFRGYFYLERTESSSDSTKFSKDETVIMRTDKSEVYMSRDHGKTWDQILKGENIKEIYPHPHFNDVCYFITTSDVVHYTVNRGDSFGKFEAPSEPTRDRDLQALGFHADYKDWLIWTGAVDCNKKGDCHNDAWYSTDRGGNWKYLLRFVRKCEFIKEAGRGDKEKLVYCEQFKDEKLNSPLELQSSDNWFADQKTYFHNIVDFATMSEFIIVASKSQSDTDSLKVDASVDGQTFADALFPKNFHVPVQKAYTVLDSHTHAVFMHVTVGNHKDAEYGSIIKSNSNGTSYVLSLDRVNRNTPGYVDFEKMLGLEGVALVNVVGNIEDAEKGNGKKLKTMITHNDGAEWSLVKAPQKDLEDNSYACNTNDLATCSLHLHGYTERRDPRAVFSSPSAVGLMMAVGNVGEYLTEKSEKTSDTFITRDGGVTWEAVKKGNYMWEYGDQGSVIIIVRDTVSTDEVFFSLDEGKTWTPYTFHNKKVHVAILSTVPSDTSLNFLLWGQEEDSDSEIVTFNLDFSQLKERERQCKLNEKDPGAADSDYYLWSPKHPLQDSNCLFGHVAQYHRKIVDRDCYNGRSIQHLHDIAKDCECTRADFECDYNFEPAKDGSCKLVSGFEPPDHSQVCKKDPKKESYFLPTGYRRVPLSTCKGGNELEKYESKEEPCPGHEPDFAKAHRGLSGLWLFIFAVVLPIGIASAVGYWVWQNWNDKFGRIRLGEQGGAFDAGQPWIKYPVAVVSGMVAVVAAVPLLVGSVWRWVSGKFGGGRRYTTRGSFARGRGDYAVVDEDELLGEDDDEEV